MQPRPAQLDVIQSTMSTYYMTLLLSAGKEGINCIHYFDKLRGLRWLWGHFVGIQVAVCGETRRRAS